MTLDRLTGQDLTNLVADEFGWPSVIGAVAIVDGEPEIDDIRRAILGNLHLVPRLRHVVMTPPVWLGGPLWVDAPSVDPAYHVQALALPPGAGEPELLDAVEQLRRRAFDASRPMWQLFLLYGLSSGRVGLYLKLHHVLADGAAVVSLLGSLLGPAAAVEAPVWSAAPAPSNRELLRDVGYRWRQSLRAVRPGRILAGVRTSWPALREFFAEGAAPRTGLNRPIGPGRRVALLRHDLDQARQIAHVAGATVNDVILTCLGGALRPALRARGDRIDGMVIRVSVPVSLHAGAGPARGNLVAPMAVPVPVGEPDDARRLRIVATDTARRRRTARPPAFTGPLSSRPAQRGMLRLMRRQRLVNAYVANVVGPARPLYLGGAALMEAFAVVPITANITLGLGVLSYAGQLNITVVADRDSWPDLSVVVEGLERSWQRLGSKVLPGQCAKPLPTGS